MNKRTAANLAKLRARCEAALRDKSQQSFYIFRGDMWAVIGACHEIERNQRKLEARADHGAQE